MNVQEAPFMGRMSSWLRLLRKKHIPDTPYAGRMVRMLAASAMTAPLRFLEHMLYDRRIKETTIHYPPIFIIGFWRSGTTYLHNILCKDPRFGFLTLFQAFAPDFFHTTEPFLKPLFARFVPPVRPMDSVPLSIDAPQEDELALFNVTHLSLYYQMFFPKDAWRIFMRYSNLNTLTKSEFEEWCSTYGWLVKKLTSYYHGKRLVLKNPANLCRINHLLKLFPDAKFVHLYRNPYWIYPSSLYMFRKLVPYCQLQAVDWKEMVSYILFIYREMMHRFFLERGYIPSNNLIEVSFEQFESNPLETVKNIYKKFDLYDDAIVDNHIANYIKNQAGYRKNEYAIDSNVIRCVNEHWSSFVKILGYDML